MLGLMDTAPRYGSGASPSGQRREVRQFAQRDVDLARRAARAEVLDGRDKFIREIFRLDELQEGALRVSGGHHDFGVEFIAVLQRDAHRRAHS